MCLLFMQGTNKKKLSREEFNSAWDSNPDWFGLYIAKGDDVRILKSQDKNIAWNMYDNNTKKKWDYDLLIWHFRLGTHWPNSKWLLHPFPLWDWSYLFHNWIINITALPNESDTSTLALFFKSLNINTEQVFSETFFEILEAVAWTYNKFIVAHWSDYMIVNEHLGHWEKDTWFSNSSYKVWSYTPKNNYIKPPYTTEDDIYLGWHYDDENDLEDEKRLESYYKAYWIM